MATSAERAKGGLTSRSIKPGAILPSRLDDLAFNGLYVKEFFTYQPRATTAAPGATGASAYGDPTGATGDLNLLHLRNGAMLTYQMIGAGQTILAPALINDPFLNDPAVALSAGLDLSATEGVEYSATATSGLRGPYITRVGTDPSPFIRVRAAFSSVANVANFAVGFRSDNSYQQVLETYSDYATLDLQAGVLNVHTELGGGGPVVFDTGEVAVDEEYHDFEVRVFGRRARYFFDGVEVPGGTPFNFDAAAKIAPFIFFLQGAGTSIWMWQELEFGPLYAIGKDPSRR